jgi:hypothetical protein
MCDDMMLALIAISIIWGVVLCAIVCNGYRTISMGVVDGIEFRCRADAAFRTHTNTILGSAKVGAFTKRFMNSNTPICHALVKDVVMFGSTVGFVLCDLHGIDSVYRHVMLRGDGTACVNRIVTPSWDVVVCVVQPRPAAGGAVPSPDMLPLIKSLLVATPPRGADDSDLGRRLLGAARDASMVIEAPAGMLDEHEGSLSDHAVDEYRQETGDDTVSGATTTKACESFCTSPGLLDERMTVWCNQTNHATDAPVDEFMKESDGLVLRGNAAEGEKTVKCLVPTRWLHLVGDCKLIAAQSCFLRKVKTA